MLHRTVFITVFLTFICLAQKPSPEALSLAKQIAAAPSDADRDRLVSQHPDLANANLRRAFANEIMRLFYESQYPVVMTLSQYLQGLAPRLNDPEGVVVGHLWPGNVQTQQGDYDQALAEYRKCIQLATSLNYKSGLTAAWNGIAIVEQRRGNYQASLDDYQQVLDQAEQDGDKERIAEVLANMGVTYHESGNYRKSLEIYDRVRQMTAGDPAWESYLLANIGAVYASQGDYSLAVEFSLKAAHLMEAQHNEREWLATLTNAAEDQIAIGHYTQAVAALRQSLPRAEKLGVKSPMASIWLDLGAAHERQGRHGIALDECRKGLAIFEELADKPGMADADACLADAALSQHEYSLALESAKSGAEFARQSSDVARLWKPLELAGEAQVALHQPDAARASFEESVAAIETMRGQIAGDERETQRFFEDKITPYYAMVELSLAQHRPDEALAWAERAKARTLADVFATPRLPITQFLTAEEREQERSLAERLAGRNSFLYAENLREHPNPAAIAAAGASLQQARNELEALQTTLYERHPELKALRGQVAPLAPEQIATLLPDRRTALLEFVTAARHTFLFVYTSGKVHSYSIPVTRQILTALVEQYRQKLTNRSTLFRPDAEALYKLLLQPAAAQLAGKNALVIVPDGLLWDLPFQALLSREGHFVIEDYAVSYAPSLSVLREMRERARRRDIVSPITLLALGNPALGAAKNTIMANTVRDRQTLDTLPDAEEEVKHIGRLFGASGSEVLTGDQAREATFKRDAPRARVLHLATHGILNNASPLYSYLVLSQDHREPGEDGLLEAWEIMQLNLHADLAVLSACETAQGRIRPGEGVIGLSWALFVAGVPTTIVSQWKVESTSTSQLMVNFYRGWKSGLPPAQALRTAARELLRDPRYHHPFYWAPFVAVGNAEYPIQ